LSFFRPNKVPHTKVRYLPSIPAISVGDIRRRRERLRRRRAAPRGLMRAAPAPFRPCHAHGLLPPVGVHGVFSRPGRISQLNSLNRPAVRTHHLAVVPAPGCASRPPRPAAYLSRPRVAARDREGEGSRQPQQGQPRGGIGSSAVSAQARLITSSVEMPSCS
jgi:hypothetical protein